MGQAVKIDTKFRYIKTKQTKNRKGELVVYVYVQLTPRRAGDPSIRLVKPPGSPEFVLEYDRAVEELKAYRQQGWDQEIEEVNHRHRHTGTVADLWLLYKASHNKGGFQRLKPSTQRQKERRLGAFVQAYGSYRWAKLESNHIAEIRDKARRRAKSASTSGVEAGNSIVKDIAAMLTWANRPEQSLTPKGWRHPCANLKIVEETDGHHAWSESEIEQFLDYWQVGTMQHTAMLCLWTTGLRASDVIKLSEMEVTDEVVQCAITKTKRGKNKYLKFKIEPELRAALNASKIANMRQTFLSTAYGQPFSSAKSFSNWFGKAVRKAGLPSYCTPHGVRKALAQKMANCGVTAPEMCTFFGWANLREAQTYIDMAESEQRSFSAREKLKVTKITVSSA